MALFINKNITQFSFVATKLLDSIQIPHLFYFFVICSIFTSYTWFFPYQVTLFLLKFLALPISFLALTHVIMILKGSFYWDKYLTAMLCYIGWVNLSAILHPESLADTWIWFIRVNTSFAIGFFTIFVLDRSGVQKIGSILAGIATANFFIVVFQLFSGALEPSSFVSDRNMFSRFQTIGHAYLLITWIQNGTKLKDYRLLGMVLIFITLIPQQSRSGIILYLFATSLIILLSQNRKLILGFTLVAVMLLVILVTPLLKRTDLSTSGISMSDLGRISAAASGINMIKSSPVTGIGYFRSLYSFKEFENKEIPGISGMTTIHMVLLSIWAETGLIGLALFLFFNIGLLIHLYRHFIFKVQDFEAKAMPLFAFVSLAVYQLHGLVYHDYCYESFYWYAVVNSILILKGDSQQRFSRKPDINVRSLS